MKIQSIEAVNSWVFLVALCDSEDFEIVERTGSSYRKQVGHYK